MKLNKQFGKNVEIINLTPHDVNVVLPNEDVWTFPSEGEARCSQKTTEAGFIGIIPITQTSFGAVEGLPEEKEGTYYIVSRLVMQACPSRKDLLVPNEIIRDDTGRIIGCRSLANN